MKKIEFPKTCPKCGFDGKTLGLWEYVQGPVFSSPYYSHFSDLLLYPCLHCGYKHKMKPLDKEWSMASTERVFESGATRDLDDEKHDPEGFLSPRVIVAFNEYMHEHRKRPDGSLRDSDNWQQGIPLSAYMKSMSRHYLDVWLHHRGFGYKAKEPLKTALVALMFNVMGYLFEVLKTEDQKKEKVP